MKIIKNSIDSEYLQESISDADLDKQMANCDVAAEVLNGHHSEGIKIPKESNMEEVKITKLTNGINGKAASPKKCNGKVNGFYEEEEEDFNLVLEDSSEGGESPSRKSAPQIVQEIEDLLGISSNSAGIQEELNNLDGTESIEDNLDNDANVQDTNSQGTEEVLEEISKDKADECKGIDNENKVIAEEIKELSNKTPETTDCDTPSHMNLVFDEVEVGMENGDLHSPNESKSTTELNEVECKVGSTTETDSLKVNDCDTSANLDKLKDTSSQEEDSKVEINKKNVVSVESTSTELPLTQRSTLSESSEEWMVVDAIETSEDEKLPESQEIVEDKLPVPRTIEKKEEIRSDGSLSVLDGVETSAEHVVRERITSERAISSTLLSCEGDAVRKRSASISDEEVELKKPKLEERCQVESTSSSVFKRSISETAENESKRSKLNETSGDGKTVDDDGSQVVDKLDKIENESKTEFAKEKQITDVPKESEIMKETQLDNEKENSCKQIITHIEKEETQTIASSSPDSEKSLKNNEEFESSAVIESSQDKLTSDFSASKENDQRNPTCSTSSSSLTAISEITQKKDEPSPITSLSEQSPDKIVTDNTIHHNSSSCEESVKKSKHKIRYNKDPDEEIISFDSKVTASSSNNDVIKEETGFKLDELSTITDKETADSNKVKEISDSSVKVETNTELPKEFSVNKELSSSIKELEKSIIKCGHEKVQSSLDLKNSESKQMSNLDFAIERVVEKARLQTEKKIPILKKFHKDQLKKLTRSDLEDIVVSKICEAVTFKSEIGQMRLQTQNLEESNDMWRKKVQQIEKQNRELEMVLKRFLAELAHIKRENQNKVPMPIKVTRSVGLQVVLASSMHGALVTSRSKMNVEAAQQQQQQQQLSVKAKQIEKEKEKEKEKLKEPAKATTFMPPSHSPLTRGRGRPAKIQTSQNSRPSTPQAISPKLTPPTTPAKAANLTPIKTIPSPNKDLEVIDLTDKEEKAKAVAQPPASGSIRVAPSTQVCFVQQGTSSAAPQQPLYLLQPKAGQRPQFLVATSSASPQRPMTNMSRPPPALTLPIFRGGGHLIPVQTSPQVGVKTSTTPSPTAVTRQVPSALRLQSQAPVNKHPAPLPTGPATVSKPGMKAPPPKPQLKIAKTNNGIMLSWSMSLSKDTAEMQSYQLYAYQEGNQAPSTGLWKKVGDVKALPLPMACTLTQFIEGHKYHFAVRAVDTHGRVGPFSTPSSILLTK